MPTAAKLFFGSTQINVGIGAAAISGAATGSYTAGGVNYEYHTFTLSGTLVVATAGLLDVLIVGGGGGASRSPRGGAGGGGSVLYQEGVYVDAGSHAITVGTGGAGSTSTYVQASSGNYSSVSFIQNYKALGGGGGGYAPNPGSTNGNAGTGASAGTVGNAGGNCSYIGTNVPGVLGLGYGNAGTAHGAGSGGSPSGARGVGIFNSITGTSYEYGAGGTAPTGDWSADTTPLLIGQGAHGNSGAAGSNGVVIVRVTV